VCFTLKSVPAGFEQRRLFRQTIENWSATGALLMLTYSPGQHPSIGGAHRIRVINGIAGPGRIADLEQEFRSWGRIPSIDMSYQASSFGAWFTKARWLLTVVFAIRRQAAPCAGLRIARPVLPANAACLPMLVSVPIVSVLHRKFDKPGQIRSSLAHN
jgi:hypothetical protein